MTKLRRANNLLYGFNERPGFWTTIVLSLQFMLFPSVSLVFPILLVSHAHVDPITAASVISISMMVIAVVTVWQSLALRRGGSGLFFSPSNAPPYLAPSLAAVSIGGLPLVFAMTMFAGVVQIIFSQVLRWIQDYFPTEIAGLVLLLIAVELATVGLAQYHQAYVATHFTGHFSGERALLLLLPIVLVLGLSIYGPKLLRLYAVVIAVVVSYIVFLSAGAMDPNDWHIITTAQWFFVPHMSIGHWHFDPALMIPFALGGIICGFKLVGSVVAIQNIQFEDHDGHDPRQIRRANMIDGFGTLLAGFLGSMGLNVSSSLVASSVAERVSARVLAYPLATIFFLASLCPKFSMMFVYLPKPIIAGILVPLGCSLFLSSLKMLLKHAKTAYSRFTLAIAFILGLSQNVYPAIYKDMPHIVHLFAGSSIAIAAIFALLANALYLHVPRKQRSADV